MSDFDAALAELGATSLRKAPDFDSALAELSAPAPLPGRMTFDTKSAALPTFDDEPIAADSASGNDPGIAESFVRGAGQTVTFGFADEISGAFESLVSDKTYKQARDESRDNFKRAAEANPIASIAGSLAGGLIPVPGMAGAGLVRGAASVANAAKVAKVAKAAMQSQTTGAAILRGAAMGGLAGVGAAEDNIATSALIGAGVGGALGGAISGVTKKLANRLPANIVGNAADGAKVKLRDAVAKKTDDVFEVVMEADAKPLRNALGISGTGFVKGKDQEKVAEIAGDLIEKYSARNSASYKAFDKATGGVSVKQLVKNLDKKIEKYMESPQTEEAANRLNAVVGRVNRTWGKDGAGLEGVRKPAREVRDFVTQIQKGADFASIDPSQTKQIQQIAAMDMKEAFDRTLVDDATDYTVGQLAKSWGAGASAKGVSDKLTQPLKEILQDNKRIHILSNIRSAAEFAANRTATNSPRVGKIGSSLVDMGLIGTGNFSGLALKKGAEAVLPRLDNAASMAAFQLIAAAKQGKPLAQLIQFAAQNGLPVAAANKAFQMYAAGGSSGGE